MSDDEGFYKRWSKRKVAEAERPRRRGLRAFAPLGDRQQAGEAPADEGQHESPAEGDALPHLEALGGEPAAPAEDTPARDGGPPAAEADLPEVESLDYDSDYTGFMAEGVSEELRKRALRRLWRSNPVLANVDGLNDYDEDFTDAALVVPNLKTAFDALRGYVADDGEEEVEAQGPVTTAEAETESQSSLGKTAGEAPGEARGGDGDGESTTGDKSS